MALTLLRSFNADEILGWSPVRFAEETEHWESVEMILIEGTSESDLAITKRKLQESERAAMIFSELCRRRLVRLLSFALQQTPHLLQAELPLHRSPLHEAARSGCPATVRCLVSAGAVVNVADDHGMTPLHEAAAAHSNDYAVHILLDAGANIDATDTGGRTALHYASRSGSVTSIQILLGKGATVDRVSADGCTALHEAATSLSVHAVRVLLDAGADKQAKSAAGWTALHWAASRGRLYTVLTLLEAGIPVDTKTVDQETPLHLAATLESPDVWEALVGAGADEGAVDKNGRAPKEIAAEKSARAVAECDNGGTNTSNLSADQSHIPPGVSNDSSLSPSDSDDLSAGNSVAQLSSVPQNSITQQAVTTTREDKGTGLEEYAPSVSGQTANNEGSSLNEALNNSINVAEELTVKKLTLGLSSVALNSTTQQTITDSQEDERTSVECLSVAPGQRKDSICSSLCEEYSEVSDATESAGETDTGEQSESTEESYSGDETASDGETGSGGKTGSDTDEEDCSSYISSANEEIGKSSERGPVNESSSPILTTNTVLFYEGPPLFHTLGTVGTSPKYNQGGTEYQGKFRGRGRGAPRGSRGNAAAYPTRSVPRKEYATELSQSQGSRRYVSTNEKGIRKGNFNGSVPQQARGQGEVNFGQPNIVQCRDGTDQPHTPTQPVMKDGYINKETHMAESKKIKKTKHAKSVSQQQGDSKVKHKKKKQPGSQHGEGHHSKRHGEGHHSKRHSEGHHSKRNGDSHYSNQQSGGYLGNQQSGGYLGNQQSGGYLGNQQRGGYLGNQQSGGYLANQLSGGYLGNQHSGGRHANQQGEGYFGNQHSGGHHANQHGEGHYGNRIVKGHHSNQHGEIHRGEPHHHNRHGEGHCGNRNGKMYYSNQYGAAYHSNQYGEDHGGNGPYVNQQGESRAGKWHGERRGGHWRGGGRGGNSRGKS